MLDLRRSDIVRPVNYHGVCAVMTPYVAVFAALALADGDRFAEKVSNNSETFSARIWNDAFQSVHLPDVPGNDIGHSRQGLRRYVAAELGTVMVDDG